MCNIFADLNLTDMETCYKAFRTPLLQSIPLRSERFGFEPEITIKLAKRQARIYETPISYSGRTYDEGKKIGLKDAFEAFWVILKTALSREFMSKRTRTYWMLSRRRAEFQSLDGRYHSSLRRATRYRGRSGDGQSHAATGGRA